MDFDKNQPIYIQIAEYVTENILLGKWKEGERIFSVRDMSINLQVNPNTVLRTYNYLQNEGVLYNQRGIGYFISDDSIEKIKDIKKIRFIESDLPEIFKTGSLLGVTPEELSRYYSEYLEEE